MNNETTRLPSDNKLSLKISIVIFLVAMGVRLAYLSEQGEHSPLFFQPLLDELESAESAKNFLRGITEPGPYFKTPGYTWLLAAVMAVFGDMWYYGIRFIQHIAGAVLVLFAMKSAGLLWGDNRLKNFVLAFTGILFALYAPMIRLEDTIGLDFWSVFFQSLLLYFIIKITINCADKKSLPAAGIMLDLSWIIRPTITVALPFLALWVLWLSRRADEEFRAASFTKSFAILFFPIILTMSAITARNAIVGGEAITMPWQGGYSFYYANGKTANGKYYLQSDFSSDSYANPTRGLAVNGYLSATGDTAKPLRYKNVDKFWFQKGTEEIKNDPLSWLKLMGRKTVYLFSDKEVFNYEDYDLQKSLSGYLRYIPVSFGVLLPLAVGLFAFRKRFTSDQKNGMLSLLAYTAVMGGGIALYYTSGRMRMPLMFPIGVAAGLGAGYFALAMKDRGKDFVLGIILLVGGAVIAWGNWWGVRSEDMSHADYSRMSNAAWRSANYKDALSYALEAEKLRPDYPVLPVLKAQSYYGLNRFDDAYTEYRKAVNRFPQDASSMSNLGVIAQYERKDYTEAADWYRKALETAPNRLSTRLRLVIVLIKSDKKDEALKIAEQIPSTDGSNITDTEKILFKAVNLYLKHGNNIDAIKSDIIENYKDNTKEQEALLKEINAS